MKVAILNLGCKVNQYECDVLARQLSDKGVQAVEQMSFADFYILNTCAVTREAERKSRQFIARIKKLNPDAKIAVCGCASQKSPQDFIIKEGVIYVSGVAGKNALLESIVEGGVDIKQLPLNYEDNPIPLASRTRFYVKIQDGCNNFCSYCIIPYLRGRSRCRSSKAVVNECLELANSGVKELVITGINLSAYDAEGGLSALTYRLSEVNSRIRFGSLEARVIDEKLLEATKTLKLFCPHFHLSLQCGDDKVLADMNRHYTTQQFYEKVELIRKYYPDAAITTDLICGFPTEDRAAFERSLAFAKKVDFSSMHVFPYSPREGTVAYKRYSNRVEDMAQRVAEAEKLAESMSRQYAMRFIDKPLSVLFEEAKDGIMSGHSENYIKVYANEQPGKIGSICEVFANKLFRDGLYAEVD